MIKLSNHRRQVLFSHNFLKTNILKIFRERKRASNTAVLLKRVVKTNFSKSSSFQNPIRLIQMSRITEKRDEGSDPIRNFQLIAVVLQ